MPVILITVLFFVILVLVVFSAVSYQGAVDVRESNNHTRAALAYVTSAVRSNAGAGVELAERDGTQVLVIDGGGSGYEQQIFFHDGKILESYSKTGSAPVSEDAMTVGEAEQFGMSWAKEDLLEIRTDLGSTYVHVRPQMQSGAD